MNQAALQLVHTTFDVDEASLLARARAGEQEAVESLVRLYLKDVYAVALRLLGDVDLAEDATQDTFLSALNGLRGFRGDASFRTWLIRIAVNAARTVGRRRTRRREVALEAVFEKEADLPDAATEIATHEEAARAVGLLGELPEKQRMAVTLRTQQGLSYNEIGQALGCSEGAARVNYHLGVKRLRELMK